MWTAPNATADVIPQVTLLQGGRYRAATLPKTVPQASLEAERTGKSWTKEQWSRETEFQQVTTLTNFSLHTSQATQGVGCVPEDIPSSSSCGPLLLFSEFLCHPTYHKDLRTFQVTIDLHGS